MDLNERLKILLPFWGLSLCYFIIPFLRTPIDAPQFFINMDMAIPFIWWLIIPYYWYYVSLFLPIFIKNEMRLRIFVQTAIHLLIISYLIFLIWPITCEPILMTRTDNPLNFMHGMITFPWLYQNAFPSVHVIIGTLVGAIMAFEYPGKNWLFWIGSGFIFFATFLIKQHYVMDAVAGLIMGLLGYYFWKNSLKEKKQ